MIHAQNTSRLAVFDGSNTDPDGGLTRVNPTSRESGLVLCDHCGTTAPRSRMVLDADPDGSGFLCAEGFGCAGPVAAAMLSPDAAARLGAVVEADLIAAGCPATPGAMTPRERKALRAELRGRVERESLRLVAVSREASGDAVKRQLKEVLRAGRALSRYLSAAKRRRQVTS